MNRDTAIYIACAAEQFFNHDDKPILTSSYVHTADIVSNANALLTASTLQPIPIKSSEIAETSKREKAFNNLKSYGCPLFVQLNVAEQSILSHQLFARIDYLTWDNALYIIKIVRYKLLELLLEHIRTNRNDARRAAHDLAVIIPESNPELFPISSDKTILLP